MSTGAAELTATTNIIVTDIYLRSINPKASSKNLKKHVAKSDAWLPEAAMGVFSILLFYLGISLGFVYMGMGIFKRQRSRYSCLGLMM